MAEPNLFENKRCSKSEMGGDVEHNKHLDSIEQIKVDVLESGALSSSSTECSSPDSQLGSSVDLDSAPPHKYDLCPMDFPDYDQDQDPSMIGAANSNMFDLELVQLNKDFCGTSDSAIELRPEMNGEYSREVRGGSSCERVVESTQETTTLIKRLSTLFLPQRSSTQQSDSLLLGSKNIRMTSEFHGRNINMASAIYSENVVTKEDNLCYQGYNIRTEGADLCIHSVVFNAEGNKFQIVIKTTEYDQFYDGVISRITSEPRILLEDDKWTMLYGTYDDDSLGVVEIEVPPGVSVAGITYVGPEQGFITIHVPQHTQLEAQQGHNSMDNINKECSHFP